MARAQKKAIMYGAGNIGRGFIGQLLSESGYEVVFMDINKEVIDTLNKNKCYPINIVSNEGEETVMVTNVRGVDSSNENNVIEEILTADVICTAVGVNVLKFIAKPIANALVKRIDNKCKPINIILCENLIDVNKVFKDLLLAQIPAMYHKKFNKYVGLVEASIGRMVPVMSEEAKAGDPTNINVEAYKQLPVDKDGFVGEMPKINNMTPFSPFKYYIHRKLFMHNMGHALTAYLGNLKGYNYIYEAISDTAIKYCVYQAEMEAAMAINFEHSNSNLKELYYSASNLIYRFNNAALLDTIERVGKDPIRKLKAGDRLTGAALLANKHGIKPVYIALGIAAAFKFCPEGDKYAEEIKAAVSANGIEAAVDAYCELTPKNSELKQLILTMYDKLSTETDIEKLIYFCDELKQK